MDAWFLIGVVAAFLGILASIALHEFGHLIPAKIFGVAANEYSVGMGPRVFAKKIGTTTYGLRALPLGGFVKLGGMFPPPGETAKADGVSAKYWALQQKKEAGWVGKGMWEIRTWQKVVILLAGPTVNLVLGIAGLVLALCLIGTPTVFTTLSAVQDGSPATTAGLRSGDRITGVNGVATPAWSDVVEQTSAGIGAPIELEYARDGATATTEVDARGGIAIGVQGTSGHELMPLAQLPAEVTDTIGDIAQAVVAFPQRVAELAVTTFTDAPRAENAPVSVVGIGDLTGQVAAQEGIPNRTKLFFLVILLAGLNFSLFFFNLLPLPPLDGGHIITAVVSSVRRRLAARRGATDPGLISPAVLMPVTLTMVGIYVLIGFVTISADFIEPVRLFE